jgi:hypothetical protein
MTLDQLIAEATELRKRFGGDTAVLVITPRGYSYPSLTDGLGFASRDGRQGEPVVVIGPGEPPGVRDTHRARCG